MLTESENNYAEALAHLTGGALLDKPTFAGGAAATEQALAELSVDTTGLDLADGSGLSGRNQVPVRVLAEVLGDVVRGTDPELAPIAPGLAVAGLTGTLADRFSTRGHATRARLRPRQDGHAHRGQQPRRHRPGRRRPDPRLRDDREQGHLAGAGAGHNGPHRQPARDVRLPVTSSRGMGLAP